ncbi:MAG: homoserine kinase [Anaerolineae bacterium]|nr:homoserine kinase [Anaerolineae bacterium]
MRKVTVRLPATMTCIGPGIRALGLALSLYATIEISERSDHQLIVDTAGEGAGHYSIGLRHPVVLGLMRVFQQAERAPLGVHIRVTSQIPVASGLGAEAAFWVAGIIGGSNLLGLSLSRQEILKLSAQIAPKPDHAISALLGGLSSAVQQADQLIYRALPIRAFPLVVVTPDIDDYPESNTPPETIPWSDAAHNLSRVPLLLEGFRTGDLPLISAMLDDRILQPRLNTRIPGYQHVRETARLAGALGVTLSGSGPSLIAFAPHHHQQVADAMIAAFGYAGIQARAHVVTIDTQGVVISAVQSS